MTVCPYQQTPRKCVILQHNLNSKIQIFFIHQHYLQETINRSIFHCVILHLKYIFIYGKIVTLFSPKIINSPQWKRAEIKNIPGLLPKFKQQRCWNMLTYSKITYDKFIRLPEEDKNCLVHPDKLSIILSNNTEQQFSNYDKKRVMGMFITGL